MPAQVLKIPMTAEFLDELEDTFVDQQKSIHRFIFELITGLCRDAKLCKLAKSTPVNRWVNGKREKEFVKFKDIKFDNYTLPFDPKWLPKDTDAEDMTSFDLKLRDKTVEYLKLHGQILSLRIQEYNQSTDIHENQILADLKRNGTDEKGLKAQEDQNKSAKEKRDNSVPSCIEQAVFEQLFPQIHQTVSRNVDEVFNSEFDEVYADQEKKRTDGIKKRAQTKATKIKKRLPGQR